MDDSNRECPYGDADFKCNKMEIPKQVEVDANIAARKLIFSTQKRNPSQPVLTMDDVVQGNQSQQQRLQLEYYSPIMKKRTMVM